MSASFTPDFKGYTGQGAFRFWCQTALPLIYDDSLSYYELLNKMVVYLNNVISDVGNMESNVNALLSAYNQLQDYVNTYFDNLDVQEEINHKLNEMAEGGTLSSLISPFVADGLPSVVGDQIDAVVADQIDASVGSQIDESVASQIESPVASNVTSWLNENVTPVGSAVVVDSSLSVSGAAADAKVTGDKITDLKNALDQVYTGIPITTIGLNKLNPNTLSDGKGLSDVGGETTDATLCDTDYIDLSDTTKTHIGLSGLNSTLTQRVWLPMYRICFYDADKVFVSQVYQTVSHTVTEIPESVAYARVCYSSPYNETRQLMVEFVNDVSDMAETYEEYQAVTVYSHGINYLDETQQDILSDIDNILSDIDNTKKSQGCTKMAWSWWIRNHIVDDYGTLYFTYITEDGHIGVAKRFPDGRCYHHNLAISRDSDDHNAPSILFLSDGKIMIIGASGHSYNNYVFCFVSTAPYSIDEFTNKSFSVANPTSGAYKFTYSQPFITDSGIFNFMRCLRGSAGGWICLFSNNNGDTWSMYTFINDTAYFTFQTVTDSTTKLKFACASNARSSGNVIRAGVLDLSTLKIYDNEGSQIGTMASVTSGDDFTTYTTPAISDMTTLNWVTGYRMRLLELCKASSTDTIMLFAKSTDTETFENFEYYRYYNGTELLLGESGRPMCMYSAYIGGAVFGIDSNNIIYAKCIGSTADSPHEIHHIVIDNGVVESDNVVKTSGMTLSRPVCYDGNSYMAMIGHYYDTSDLEHAGSFVDWKFNVLFG